VSERQESAAGAPHGAAGAGLAGAPVRRAQGRDAWLSNGGYRVLVTARGGGCSALGPVALTRWRADALADGDGLALFVRDLDSGRFGPLCGAHAGTEVGRCRREPGRVLISRVVARLEARLEIAVAPDAPCELRRLELHNPLGTPRRIEVTTFCEVALLPQAADLSHPAFSRLFVETEFVAADGALLARRRPRTATERWPVMAHALIGDGALEFETDRARFFGRGFDPARPCALDGPEPLSGTVGAVLDPALCLRRTFEIAPHGTVTLIAVLGAGADREAALALARRFAVPARVREALERTADAEAASWRELELGAEEVAQLDALGAALLCGAVRPIAAEPGERDLRDAEQRLSALGLDPRAVRVVADLRRDAPGAGTPAALERAARRWSSLGLDIECCALVRDRAAREATSRDLLHVLEAGALEPADADALLRTASLVLAREGWPAPAVTPGRPPADTERRSARAAALAGPSAAPGRAPDRARAAERAPSPADAATLQFFNGYGGFSAAGDEYVIRVTADAQGRLTLPPRPWVNVIANPHFGFLFSETGAGCTWSLNSREHRLTPWSNDAVLDPHDEALYLRDDASGEFWSPLPGPAPAPSGTYEVRHGWGASVCRLECAGLEQETSVFVPEHDPVKIVQLVIRNRGERPRRLSLFAVQSLVMGELRSRGARTIETWADPAQRAVLARNRVGGEFAGRVAFASVAVFGAEARVRLGGDRAAFLGAGGSMRSPRALALDELEGLFGPGRDPAFAAQARFELAAGDEVTVVLLLGEGEHRDDATALLTRYRAPRAAAEALTQVRRFWNNLLGTIHIATPSPALDLMVNGWLIYQTVSCRLWGRTAFHQSGGAYGFRDQLQDALALTSLRPDWTRAQLLLHAAHQFIEGDVLHWWHPPGDRGLRTRVVDDRLWLPYGAAQYVHATGDVTVLGEMTPYLRGPVLEPGQDEAFLQPEPAQQFRDLYEHCCHAIDCSLATGAHHLPLFGTGDWNDGMNAVGREGRGESVWMGFFLFTVLGEFVPLCRLRGDLARGNRYEEERERLRAALEAEAWDGEWYRRGWYDDGTPLGSDAGDECKIDALAQAWAALSGAAPRGRVEQALASLERHLIDPSARLVRLLAPPFDRTPHHPGYIKGYVPGVRENGGQYTHAALWVARAFAETGHAERAAQLLEWISPVSRSLTREQADVYQSEPYVVAADIYAEPPHVGRGGWTWYTGSSGWMYRTVTESLLGLSIEAGRTLRIAPHWPAAWRECRVRFSPPGARSSFEITMAHPGGENPRLADASLDGEPLAIEDGAVRLAIPQDDAVHEVVLILGAGAKR
jgi:cyclic beta-1,2-glucan synthetase